MKYFSFVILLFPVMISLSSCLSVFSKKNSGEMKEHIRSVEKYTDFVIRGFCEVVLTNSEQGDIKIFAGENIIDKIIIQSKNNELYISFDNLNDYNLSGTKLYIPAINLKSISAKGAGVLSTEKTLTADSFLCNFSGAGDFSLDFECQELKINNDGASNLNLKGNTYNLTLNCYGAGNVNAENLIAKTLTLNAKGASKISAYCKESVSVKIEGVSDVTIYGQPANKTIKKQGVSSIVFN